MDVGHIQPDAALSAALEDDKVDTQLQRTRLLTALAAGNRSALQEVLSGLPTAMRTESHAAQKAIEFLVSLVVAYTLPEKYQLSQFSLVYLRSVLVALACRQQRRAK